MYRYFVIYSSEFSRHNTSCCFWTSYTKGRRDGSVGTALGYALDERGSRVRFLVGTGNFSPHYRVRNGSGATLPLIQWVSSALSLGAKRSEREADHSPQSRPEVKVCVDLYLHSPIRLHGVVLTYKKHRDAFTSYLPMGLWEFFSSLPRPERLWGPPSLLSDEYQGLFPWE
jgi:hypothetical protein